jgi:hypothetical protein
MLNEVAIMDVIVVIVVMACYVMCPLYDTSKVMTIEIGGRTNYQLYVNELS